MTPPPAHQIPYRPQNIGPFLWLMSHWKGRKQRHLLCPVSAKVKKYSQPYWHRSVCLSSREMQETDICWSWLVSFDYLHRQSVSPVSHNSCVVTHDVATRPRLTQIFTPRSSAEFLKNILEDPGRIWEWTKYDPPLSHGRPFIRSKSFYLWNLNFI